MFLKGLAIHTFSVTSFVPFLLSNGSTEIMCDAIVLENIGHGNLYLECSAIIPTSTN